MVVTMATPISSHVKDKNSIFTECDEDMIFLVKGKILVFHQYIYNKDWYLITCGQIVSFLASCYPSFVLVCVCVSPLILYIVLKQKTNVIFTNAVPSISRVSRFTLASEKGSFIMANGISVAVMLVCSAFVYS